MSQINDCKNAALVIQTGQEGQTDDLELIYLQNNGATSSNVQDAWMEVFAAGGVTEGAFNDRFDAWLDTLGAPDLSLDDKRFWFWCQLGGSLGPTAYVVQVSGDSCEYDACVTIPGLRAEEGSACTTVTRYEARWSNFTNDPDQFTWGVTGGTITGGGGIGDNFVEVSVTSDVNATTNITLTATDSVSSDTSSSDKDFTTRHTDVTAPAYFKGPLVNDVTFVQDVDIGIFSFRPLFADEFDDPAGCFGDDFAVVGTLPVGLSLSSLGLLTGTPTNVEVATDIQISMTSAGGIAYTNTFNMTIQDAQEEDVVISTVVEGICAFSTGESCTAIGEYLATPSGFSVAPDSYVWSISSVVSGNPIIETGQGTDTVTISTIGDVDSVFTMKCIASNVGGESAERLYQVTQQHIEQAATILLPLRTSLWSTDRLYDATFARNSGATVIDHEGIMQTCLPNEARFQGARRVENIIRIFAVRESGAGTVTNNGDGSFDVSCPDNSTDRAAVQLYLNGTETGHVYVARCSISNLDTGASISAALNFSPVAASSVYKNSTNIQSEGAMACDLYENGSVGSGTAIFEIGTYITGMIDGQCNFTVFDIQVEDMGVIPWVQGTHIAPSEFIDKDTDYGAGVNAVKYFPTTNGNTVDVNGVVTEAAGTALTTLDGILIEEESSNLFNWSNDVTEWFSATTTIHDFESATFIDTNGYVGRDAATLDGETYTVTFQVKSPDLTELRLYNANSADGTRTDVPYTITTEWQNIEMQISGRTGGGPVRFGVACPISGIGTIYVKDFQVEQKPYTTSFIPTSGAVATRLADNCQTDWVAGLVNDFVIGFDYTYPDTNLLANKYYFRITGTGGQVRMNSSGANRGNFDVDNNTVNAPVWYPPLSGEAIKHQGRMSATQGFNYFVNGVKGATNPSTADSLIVAPYSFYIGSYDGNVAQINGTIKNVSVYEGDLTDQEVEDL